MNLDKWIGYVEKKKRLVVFLHDLPEVMVNESTTFGPYSEGDVVFLKDIPTTIRNVLFERKVIRVIN